MQKQGRSDAFLSAGNTGATLAASTVLLGLHDGVERATVATLFPTGGEPVLVLDGGANLDCSAQELVGFAYLGTVYMRDILGRPKPVVGLLNIGEEEEKGTAIVREAHQLLKQSSRPELRRQHRGPRHPARARSAGPSGRRRVRRLRRQRGAQVLRVGRRGCSSGCCRSGRPTSSSGPRCRELVSLLDYSEYGGAPLLGVRGVSIICHGSSSPNAIKNGIRVAVQAVDVGPQRAHRGRVRAARARGARHDRRARSPRWRASAWPCPPASSPTHDLSRMLDTSDEWIVERTGIRERHIARPEQTRRHAEPGGERAGAWPRPGVTAAELDAIVLATASPDRLLPSTACDLQALLGAEQRRGVRHRRGVPGLRLRAHRGRGPHRLGAERDRARGRGREALHHHRLPGPLHRHPLRRRRRRLGGAPLVGRPAAASSPPSSSPTGASRRCSTGRAAARPIRSARRSSASGPTT